MTGFFKTCGILDVHCDSSELNDYEIVVFPNALPQTVPSADQNLLGLSLIRISRQVVSVV